MRVPILFAAAAAVLAPMATTNAAPISIVAAENFYGEAARAIGGDAVVVTDVLASASADPHDFEPTPSVARAIADAAIVIYNGADYDPWMDRLLAASNAPQRVAINVADLIGRKAGDNPHVWYDPAAMPAAAAAIVEALATADATNAAAYRERGRAYQDSLGAVADRVAAVKGRFAGQPVTATEPVFGYMADALGLDMRNGEFQTAIMNETEPSPRETAAMEADLREGKVKILFYNEQVTDPLTEHLRGLALTAGVQVVGVTETEPPGKSYVEWMLSTIDATEKALAAPGT